MHFLNPCIDLTVYIVTTCTARNFCDGKTCSFAFTALSEIFWNRQYIIDVPVEQVILMAVLVSGISIRLCWEAR